MPAFSPEQVAAAQLVIYRIVAELEDDAYNDSIAGVTWLTEDDHPLFTTEEGVVVCLGDFIYANLSLLLSLFWAVVDEDGNPRELIQEMGVNVAAMGMPET